jgi:hypothetical protein
MAARGVNLEPLLPHRSTLKRQGSIPEVRFAELTCQVAPQVLALARFGTHASLEEFS